MKPLFRCLSLCVLWVVSNVHADPLYTELSYMYNTVKVGGGKANPRAIKAKLGYIVAPMYTLELQLASGIEDDKANQVTVDISSLASLFLRYGSAIDRRTSLYLLVGATQIKLDYTGKTDDEYSDFSYGIGMEEKMKRSKSWYYTLEYVRYYKDDNLDISGISLGVRYDI